MSDIIIQIDLVFTFKFDKIDFDCQFELIKLIGSYLYFEYSEERNFFYIHKTFIFYILCHAFNICVSNCPKCSYNSFLNQNINESCLIQHHIYNYLFNNNNKYIYILKCSIDVTCLTSAVSRKR